MKPWTAFGKTARCGSSCRHAAVICGVLLLAAAVEIRAMPVPSEPDAAPTLENEELQQEPRYRLQSPAPLPPAAAPSGRTEADFTWPALTGNGPASGALPVIGDASGKSYYDFHDELEHPYFILKLPRSR